MLSEELGGLSGGLEEQTRKISPHQKMRFALDDQVDEAAPRRSSAHFVFAAVPRSKKQPYSPRYKRQRVKWWLTGRATPVSLSAACLAKSADAERRTTREAHRAASRALRYAAAARRRPKPRPNRPAARAGRRRQKSAAQKKKPWRRPPPPARAASAPSRT